MEEKDSHIRKRGQAGAPAPVFADKKKRALAKVEKYLTKGAEPAIEEGPVEQPRPKRKRRSELQRLEQNMLFERCENNNTSFCVK